MYNKHEEKHQLKKDIKSKLVFLSFKFQHMHAVRAKISFQLI